MLEEGDIRDFTFQNFGEWEPYTSRSTSICGKLDGHVLVQIPPYHGRSLVKSGSFFVIIPPFLQYLDAVS